MQQAEDFRAESVALYELLTPVHSDQFEDTTLFKNWSINAVLQHLHLWNINAGLQVTDEQQLMKNLEAVMRHKGGLRGFETDYLGGLVGKALLEEWHTGVHKTADTFARCDPKARLKWAGPDMSARSSITARLMETWAHGQAIYDHLGVVRSNADRIKNIVVLGVNTFRWTYQCRQQEPPGEMPFLSLKAPSGENWTFGNDQNKNRIEGLAEEFCQVVTQCRNIADTSLTVIGEDAKDWMSKAQCFAGRPESPPPPGLRKMREQR